MPRKEPSPLPSQPRRGTETRGDDLTQRRAKPALKTAPPQRAGNARNRYREDADPSGWAGGESNTSIAGGSEASSSRSEPQREKKPTKASATPVKSASATPVKSASATPAPSKKAAVNRSRPGRKDSPRSDDKKGAAGEGERWYGRGWSDPQKGLQRPSRGETKAERELFGKKTKPTTKRRR